MQAVEACLSQLAPALQTTSANRYPHTPQSCSSNITQLQQAKDRYTTGWCMQNLLFVQADAFPSAMHELGPFPPVRALISAHTPDTMRVLLFPNFHLSKLPALELLCRSSGPFPFLPIVLNLQTQAPDDSYNNNGPAALHLGGALLLDKPRQDASSHWPGYFSCQVHEVFPFLLGAWQSPK